MRHRVVNPTARPPPAAGAASARSRSPSRAISALAIATARASGFVIGGKWKTPLAVAKLRRMPFIAANGLLVLLPSAFFLASRSAAGRFDGWFYAVQAIELVAGATNLTLMGLNIRDGLRLSRRIAGGRRSRALPGFHAATVKLSSKE